MKIPRYIIFVSVFAVLCIIFICIGSCRGNKIEVNSEPVASSIPTTKPTVKVFIENSGSMDGYMCDGSQLKDAIYDYISDLNRSTDTTSLYYINSQIIPYKGNLSSYIRDLNPETFHKAGGNRASTDLGNIIASVLASVNNTTVAILISDCILDLPSKDAKKFLTHCEIRLKDEIINTRKRVHDLGIEILKMSSDFDGKYFYPDGKVENLRGVKRPYYIWIFGNKNYLAQLNSAVPLSQLEKHGLKGIVSFSNLSDVPFELFNNNQTGKVAIPSNGAYHLIAKADFRTTLQPDGVVLDKTNFSFHNPVISVDGIYPISDSKSEYSHYIKFSIPATTPIAQEAITFSKAKMPSWVSASNDETGTNIQKNLDKTIGIRYLIQGVADAYKDDKEYSILKFNVKHK